MEGGHIPAAVLLPESHAVSFSVPLRLHLGFHLCLLSFEFPLNGTHCRAGLQEVVIKHLICIQPHILFRFPLLS